jgi:uncharacterized protein
MGLKFSAFPRSDTGMTPTPDPLLRCPIDPKRNSTLTRTEAGYVCDCACTFPVRNGLPILLASEAELPEGCEAVDKLPCRKRAPKKA